MSGRFVFHFLGGIVFCNWVMSVLDYSKWDNIEVSSDEEIEDLDVPMESQDAPPSIMQTVAKKDVKKSKARYGSLDYSKWDDLEVSSDEEEMKPKIQKLNKPSSITIGPGGYKINSSKPQIKPKKVARMPSEWSLNGNKLSEYVWSQTRDFLEVRIFVPKKTRANQVRIELNSKGCKVYIKDDLFIEGLFLFDIHDHEDEMDIDWEIIEHPSVPGRVLVLTGLQKNPPAGLYNWWDKFFKREEAVDSRNFKGRKDQKHQDVWRAAHEMFKNKVKNQGKIPIPVFDNETAVDDSKDENEI